MPDVPPTIVELVETFDRNIDAYKNQAYNEAQVRREFIDPFFEALGWDVTNRKGYAPAYKDVIHEDAIKVGGATKAPDYCFRIGGTRKFFLEAKKPSLDIKGDPHPAYQLRRYAWSAKLPLSVLTDFEEFAVYDCQIRPKQTDKADTARIRYYTYKQYLDKWHDIESIFSKDAIFKGSFDKFAASTKGKRGTTTVDAEFLAEIEKWRQMLARSIALRNPDLTRDQLNFAVQRTIDRILFLRMCEDRGIETYSQLLALSTGRDSYPRLCGLFRQADDKYNSGLFHFRPEKNRPHPDELTPNITVDDTPLQWILHSLYYPQCPYEFSVLPAEILGNVYEQFLGKVIRLTPGHRAVVEEKPEVKKAGGVYYTPAYIVDYIVRNTVGKLLGITDQLLAPGTAGGPPRTKNAKPLTPTQIAKLRILDPACGSGSFLLGAYTFLLDYHRDWYVAHDPEKHTDKIYQGRAGHHFLTIKEKKRILLNNIFGVDIDPQAVEVTKLALLLKVLEGENAETIGQIYKMFHERALPDLADNIKCGNSLIGPDFFDNGQRLAPGPVPGGPKPLAPGFTRRPSGGPVPGGTDDLHKRINPFDWNAEFPQVFSGQNPGFDAVIGNPPYVRIQTLRETQPESIDYFSKNYQSASKGNYDIYVVFVERALQLLNDTGRMGYILPHKFFNAKYGQSIRKLIADGKHLSHVVHFGDQQVFAGATTYTCLLFLTNSTNPSFNFAKVESLLDWQTSLLSTSGHITGNHVTDSEWNFLVGSYAALYEKLRNMPYRFADVASQIAQGIRTSANEIYVLDLLREGTDTIVAYSKSLDSQVELDRPTLSPFLLGREIKRYQILDSRKVVIIPYTLDANTVTLIPEDVLQKASPHTYDYLRHNKKALEARERGRMRGPQWYAYIYPKNLHAMRSPKILIPDIANHASYVLDPMGTFAFTSGYALLPRPELSESFEYLLGILNSSVLDFFLKRISTPFRGGFFRYFTQFIEALPFRQIDFDNPDDKRKHDKMVALVERMLDLHKKLAAAKIPTEKTQIQRQITATDKKIDSLVYKLYNLTPEEIQIIEEANA